MKQMYFGGNAEGTAFFIGDPSEPIKRIYINGRRQYAKNEFRSVLCRFERIGGIKYGDYQRTISKLFA